MLYKSGQLLIKKCKSWLVIYLDFIYWIIVFSIIIYRAKIRYYRLKRKIISNNLILTTNNLETLIKDLKTQIAINQLTKINKVRDYFIYFFYD